MLEFKTLESSHMVVVDGKGYPITHRDIDGMWWDTVDLLDNDHVGPAPIILGDSTVVLNEADWKDLHNQTHEYIMAQFDMDSSADMVVLH